MKLSILFPIFLFMICGCAGGIIANLIPAPKILEGNITESRYESPQKHFSVLTPFPEGSNHFTYMTVKENSQDSWESVVFQSSTKPHSIFRIETGIATLKDTVRSSEVYANETFAYFKKRYEESGMTDYELTNEGEAKLSGKKYEYRIAKYNVPSQFLLGNLATTEPYSGWSIILVHAQPEGVTFQSYDFGGECQPCKDGNPYQILENRNDISRMVNSLQVPTLE